jgi:enoyl-[acyl-carrier protein] reductase I
MADNKAYLESIARSFGYFFSRDKKVRVNTISQSPTATKQVRQLKVLSFVAFSEKCHLR